MKALKSWGAKFILFQVLWYLIIYFGAIEWHWAGLAVATIGLVFDRFWWGGLPTRSWVLFLLMIVFLGGIHDGLVVGLDFVEFTGDWNRFSPPWMWGMWIMFAVYFHEGFENLSSSLWPFVIMGLIGGPLAFYGGVKMGAVSFNDGAVYILAALWGFIIPSLVWAYKVLKKNQHPVLMAVKS